MITKVDRIIASMSAADINDLYAAVVSIMREKRENVAMLMTERGYEHVDNTGAVTPDGREIISVHGHAYALRPDVHAERLAQAFEAAKKQQSEPETQSVVGTESLSSMACPKCGDSLQHTAVCPKCTAGKLGYRHRYTCVCGGVDMVSKEPL